MNNLFTTVYDIGVVGRLIVLTLIILSVVAWGIIIEKIILFSRARRENNRFFALFQTYRDWSKIESEIQDFRYSPFSYLFEKLYAEARNGIRLNPSSAKTGDINNSEETRVSPIEIYKTLADSAINTEIMLYEKRLVILSSTVSASPFLGLFGTVWGIMDAFMSMGMKGSAAITAIGPGIAEALITTVAGLAVAIPVLFAYNLIADKIRKYENQMQILANEMINKIAIGNIHGGPQI